MSLLDDTCDMTLWAAIQRRDVRAVAEQMFPREPQQPRNRTSFAPVEGSSPTAGLGTAEAGDPCERCHGTKRVTLYGTYMGDADDQPCPECE